jgi:hypothetical protein
MDDLVQFFSLRLVDLLDDICHTPLWQLLAWAIAETLSLVMIATLTPSFGERLKAAIYFGLGLIAFVEVFRPLGWSMFFG